MAPQLRAIGLLMRISQTLQMDFRNSKNRHRSVGTVLLLLLIMAGIFPGCHGRERVAVCVSGQLGRLMPEYFVDGLVLANPGFYFHFLFNLYNSPPIYTTKHVLVETIYQNMTDVELSSSLHNMFDLANSAVEGVVSERLYTRTEWKHRTGQRELGLFQQFAKSGHVMLNMYKHHEDCANRLLNLKGGKTLNFHILYQHEKTYFSLSR